MKASDNLNESREMRFKPNKAASLIAGVGLLLMAVVAGLAYGYFHGKIVVLNDAQATEQALSQNRGLFITEIVLWWLIFLLDIIVAVALFLFYKKSGAALSAATMISRLLYTAVLGISIIVLTGALEAREKTLERIVLFEAIWSIGLIIFGLHLFLLGILAAKMRLTPLPISWLVAFGGACYIILHSIKAINSAWLGAHPTIEQFLSIPMALSELSLAIWLIYGAIKHSRHNTAVA